MSEISERVPHKVATIIRKNGIYLPDEMSEASRELYERTVAGHCMLCNSECAETTCLIVNDLGVVMMFCQQVCLQDFLNMHWMMERYDDMVEAAKFRSQEGNN